MPSCASLYIYDIAIANGNNYYIKTNFLGNTFDESGLSDYATLYWYGFGRNDIFSKLKQIKNILQYIFP